MKVAIVAYEDGDLKNIRGPISSEARYFCFWDNAGVSGLDG